MTRLFFDASVLAKRYAAERGAPLVNRIFAKVPIHRMMCLMLGAGEVAAVIVRRHNSGELSYESFTHASDELLREVVESSEFATLPFTNADVVAAIPLLVRHHVNITDAALLQILIEPTAAAAAAGDQRVLVASDERLLRAARAEHLNAFNPETASEAELEALTA